MGATTSKSQQKSMPCLKKKKKMTPFPRLDTSFCSVTEWNSFVCICASVDWPRGNFLVGPSASSDSSYQVRILLITQLPNLFLWWTWPVFGVSIWLHTACDSRSLHWASNPPSAHDIRYSPALLSGLFCCKYSLSIHRDTPIAWIVLFITNYN